MRLTLASGHLAPTRPDMLASYIKYDKDPLILSELQAERNQSASAELARAVFFATCEPARARGFSFERDEGGL